MATSRMNVDKKSRKKTFKTFLQTWKNSQVDAKDAQRQEKKAKSHDRRKVGAFKDTKAYLEEVRRLLKARGAKTWNDVYPDVESTASPNHSGGYESDIDSDSDSDDEKKSEETAYLYISTDYLRQFVPQHTVSEYDQLYEACYAGDDAKIQRLCLPAEGAGDKDKKRPLNISVFIHDKTLGPYSKAGKKKIFSESPDFS